MLGAPASIDWRAQGKVTSIKKQGVCNGCYAFAAAAAVESLYAIKTGKLVEMSAQQLVDCSKGFGQNNGCKGGFPSESFNYLKNKKLMTWDSYPYEEKSGSCKYSASSGVTSVTGFKTVPPNNPAAMMAAVAQQPVTVPINS